MKLSKSERETHIYQSEDDSCWYLWTEIKSMQRLLVKRGYRADPKTGEFKLPKSAVSIRSLRSAKTSTAASVLNLKKAREAKAAKQMVVSSDSSI